MESYMINLININRPSEEQIQAAVEAMQPYFGWAAIIAGTLALIALLIARYLEKRNDAVYDFRTKVSHYTYTRKSVLQEDKELWAKYLDRLPSYDELVWKFWLPLRIDYYFSDEEIADMENQHSELVEMSQQAYERTTQEVPKEKA